MGSFLDHAAVQNKSVSILLGFKKQKGRKLLPEGLVSRLVDFVVKCNFVFLFMFRGHFISTRYAVGVSAAVTQQFSPRGKR